MTRTLTALLLFVIQAWLVVKGLEVFGKDLNPFLLFADSMLLAIYFFYSILNGGTEVVNSRPKQLIGFVLGAFSIAALCWSLRSLFHEYPDAGQWSDVIPQLQTLYTRFANGTQPYHELEQYAWKPYPVYMPMHWLPVSIPLALGIDLRWVGILLVLISTGILAGWIWRNETNVPAKVLSLVLPSGVLLAYIREEPVGLGVSLETVVAAYYLLLAAGLASRNLVLTTTGTILCLLSRYTMVFWLPLFLVLLWFKVPKKTNVLVWLSIVLSVLLIYVLPFYANDPTILKNGLAYHNHCAVAEWVGMGDPPVSGTFEYGLYFAPYLKSLFTGDMTHRVFMDRVLQLLLMAGLTAVSLLMYRKWKHRMNIYDLGLGMLYLFMLFFYMFGPLLYAYYYIPLLMISAVMCGKIMLLRKQL